MTQALKSNHECCFMCQFIFPLWLLLSFHPFTSFPVVPGPPPPPCPELTLALSLCFQGLNHIRANLLWTGQ